MKSTFSRPTTARPRVEALEDRCCPAVWADSGTLHIWGTSLADNATIAQNDDTGFLTVTLNGETTYYASSTISAIDVRLYGGGDDFEWTLTGNSHKYAKTATVALGDGYNEAGFWFNGAGKRLEASLDITVTGGAQKDIVYANFGRTSFGDLSYTANLLGGDDIATAHLWGDVTNSDVRFELNGGEGKDDLRSWNTYDSNYSAYNSLDVNIFSSLEVRLNGNNGDDTLNMLYSGELDGLLVLRMDGGADNDSVKADVYVKSGSVGTVDATLSGGPGFDSMYFNLNEAPGSNIDILNALLDGGPGLFDTYDAAKTTSNVTVVNFP